MMIMDYLSTGMEVQDDHRTAYLVLRFDQTGVERYILLRPEVLSPKVIIRRFPVLTMEGYGINGDLS
jgi:hypothetical protein